MTPLTGRTRRQRRWDAFLERLWGLSGCALVALVWWLLEHFCRR